MPRLLEPWGLEPRCLPAAHALLMCVGGDRLHGAGLVHSAHRRRSTCQNVGGQSTEGHFDVSYIHAVTYGRAATFQTIG